MAAFNNLKIGVKILLGYFVLIALIIVAAGAIYWGQARAQEANALALKRQTDTSHVWAMLYYMNRQYRAQADLIINGTADSIQAFQAASVEMDKYKALALGNADTAEEKQWASQVQQADQQYGNLFTQQIVPAFQAGDQAKLKDLDGQSDKPLAQMETVVQQIQSSYQAEVATAVAASAAAETGMLWILLGSTLAASLIGLLAGIFISRSITVPMQIATTAVDDLSHGVTDSRISDSARTGLLARADEIGRLIRSVVAMRKYFTELADAAKAVAAGDLTATVQPQGEGDVLGSSMAQMIANLRGLVGQVTENASNVTAAAGQLESVAGEAGQATNQIASTIQQVAKGTSQQTESVTRTAHSVEEMKRAIDGVAGGAQNQAQSVSQATVVMSQVSKAVEGIRQGTVAQAQGMERATAARNSLAEALQQVSGATEQVATEAQQAARSAGDGASLVAKTVDGIQQVRTATEQLAERVSGLGKQSAQIGTIIETIEDIASQTNLLALNAAIEAARAGEHGKGFAVVADEVRKLAERSATATKEIAAMIRTIQNEASEAVQAMGQAATDVSAAVKLTDQAGAAFREIAEKSQSSASRMVTVREAVDAMRRANEQLEKTVTEVVSITGHNQQAAESMGQLNNQLVESLDAVSAVVEENTAATEEMAAGSSEVAQSIEAIASVSEENSAAVEEVSASAEEMSAQVHEVTAAAQSLAELARTLQELVAQFKLEAEPAPNRPAGGSPKAALGAPRSKALRPVGARQSDRP